MKSVTIHIELKKNDIINYINNNCSGGGAD